MEVVLVQLSHETGKVAVFEVLRKDGLGKFFALNAVFGQPRGLRPQERWREWEMRRERRTSKTTKLSPSSPHRTISAYDGSSSILCEEY